MHIVEGDSSTGFRIGGLPPIGVQPQFKNGDTQYFGTFPITGHQEEELSIFCSFNCSNTSDPLFISKNINKVLGKDSKVIECVFHSPARRTESSSFGSDLHGYGVKIGRESTDSLKSEAVGVAHKIGGIAFFEHYHPNVRKIAKELLDSGYTHLLQWSYPGAGDCNVRGEWVFADYGFHLYLKQAKSNYEYKALLV